MIKVIGLTGGIASGKSTVVDFLISQGFRVIDADKVVHELQLPGGKLYQEILINFGTEFFDENKQLNRAKLGELVFSDDKAREKLAKLQNKIIREELYTRRDNLLTELSKMLQTENNNLTELSKKTVQNTVIFMDIPLLLEQHYDGFDEIWLIAVSENIQLERVMLRDNLSEKAAEARIAAQMSLTEKMKYADKVIDSSGTFEETQAQVLQALDTLK
ncbi:dephospho-CoA kinase [Lactococcus nasutitermitis]|uniref:Dephospho-CoA kinase n=1 Tax=Lactococcus nasutitermitis TaxID=1652957 RepID=A0ABV9J9X9_9LACT|nr:dephospho-CoA kinase [Lactococcus nasutitermitis]